jgi:hypothetical protein
VTRTPRGVGRELLFFGRVKEGPGGSDHRRGQVASEWYQNPKYRRYIAGERREGEKENTLILTTCVRVVSKPEKSSLFSGNREKRITPCHPEERGSHLIMKTGMPEGGEGQTGNPEMERQIRDLRVRLEEMETT